MAQKLTLVLINTPLKPEETFDNFYGLRKHRCKMI